jgi:hypothetical protein
MEKIQWIEHTFSKDEFSKFVEENYLICIRTKNLKYDTIKIFQCKICKFEMKYQVNKKFELMFSVFSKNLKSHNCHPNEEQKKELNILKLKSVFKNSVSNVIDIAHPHKIVQKIFADNNINLNCN